MILTDRLNAQPQAIPSFVMARVAIQRLADHFNVRQPSVDRGTGRTSKAYGGSRWSITMSDRSSFGDTPGGYGFVVLHEFAHILTYARENQRCGHDIRFYRHLKSVITAWGHDLAAYPWEREYWTLWSFARREGLTQKPWRKQAVRDGLAKAVVAGAVAEVFARPGDTVEFNARGQVVRGRVVSAYRGYRARVAVDGNRFWMVPQPELRVVATVQA